MRRRPVDELAAQVDHGSSGEFASPGPWPGAVPEQLPCGAARTRLPGEDCHVIANTAWRNAPGVREQLGPVGIHTRGHPNIFPNLWVVGGGTQLMLRLPKGLGKTETWYFTIAETSLSADEKRARVSMATHTHGPAGFLEQDDGENWDQSARGTRGVVARRSPLSRPRSPLWPEKPT